MSDRVMHAWWDRLGWDLTELILSKLPLRSMLRASAVCKPWRAVLQQQLEAPGRPWLFLHGHNNVVPRLGRTAFAYDPRDGDSWVTFTLPPDCFAGAGGLAFAFSSPSPSRLSFAPLLHDSAWTSTAPPLASSRCSPVVACSSDRRLFLVVGGARFVGGLVDIDEDPLPTELLEYDPSGVWRRERCAPLPAEFGMSSLWLSSALVAGRFFFVCDTYSCTVSAFDLPRRAWTAPRELRPAQGLVAAFLASGRGGQRLVLAGLEEGGTAFGVWDVEPRTLTARRIGEMPPELLGSMLPGSLRCVGEDGVLYVISEGRHRAYPACACEVIGGEGEELACSWRKLPPLPVAGSSALSRFHKIVAFSSPVLLHHYLPPQIVTSPQ